VNTIESNYDLALIAKQNFEMAGYRNITQHFGNTDELLPELINNESAPGFVLLSASYSEQQLKRCFDKIESLAVSDTVIIIDRINLSKSVMDTWNIIRKYEKVSVSIDLNRMGILFFRKGIAHNYYQIRY
jgi:predicted O-methyltransferase YrrM